jgi:hypothetical protein
MALTKTFARKLDALWHRRSAEIRALGLRHRGRPKLFTRAIREKGINALQETATAILLKKGAKRELRKLVVAQYWRRIRGYGLDSRFGAMTRGLADVVGGPIVYSFWKGQRCLYVGKGRSIRRLHHYQKSAYLVQATRLKVVEVKGKSHLPKAECLSTHLYEPRDQKVKAADTKWGKKCPICRTHDQIREGLRFLFAIK